MEAFLPDEKMEDLCGELLRHYHVWTPVSRDGAFVFSEIAEAASVRLDYSTTLLPPKSAFLPTTEVLLQMNVESGEHRIPAEPDKPIALFGVHPCDLHGLSRIDLSMREIPADAPYLRSRQDALLIGLACVNRCRPEAFCDSMGTFRSNEDWDLFLTPIEGGFWVQVRSDSARFIAEQSKALEPATEHRRGQYDSVLRGIDRTFSSRRLNLETLAADLPKTYSDGWWGELAKRCFSCGACTAVCPTCVCFDVNDEFLDGCRTSQRCRSWDSCLLKDFAVVAGGENFRADRAARLRHRMMRQGSYLARRFGLESFCVGCGRCPYVCLGKINPLDVFARAQKEAASHAG